MFESVYAAEERRKVMVIDSKSFYASVESVDRGLNPLQSMLVVMSMQANTNGGLVLAASPRAKKVLGIKNVMRQRDLPKDPRLVIVQPRMNYYIQKNKEVNDIFREFVSEEDLLLYSIDESLIDVTSSWSYLQYKYGKDLTMAKLARIIQLEVKNRLGLYLTVGIGDNPVQAKMALDISAKHAHSLIGEWHFETIPETLWQVDDISEVWSIGSSTARRLAKLRVHSMYDLAHIDPGVLYKEFGKVKSSELYALAWGIDRSIISQRYRPKEKSYSNGQVLPRDYRVQAEIENVIREIGEQVASRLRAKNVAASILHLGIGFSYKESEESGSHGFSGQISIAPTNQSDEIATALKTLFRRHYQGEVVRNVYVAAGKLSAGNIVQLDLFEPVHQTESKHVVDHVVDDIRKKFGITSIVKLASAGMGGTMINRAGLVGGHNGGNAFG
jgi:DNA polymerase V